MTVWHAILLGLVQGVAEIFPISGSAHLSALQSFLRIGTEEHLLFAALLHLAVCAAVVAAFFPEVKALGCEAMQAVHPGSMPHGKRPDRLLRRMLSFLIIGTLPLLPALLVRTGAKNLSANTFFVGFALLLTGGLLFWADRRGHGKKDLKNATLGDVLMIGIAQMLAVLPGISRTGATIGTGLLRGFDRNFAMRYSFLLYIPAALGAMVSAFIDATGSTVLWQYVPLYLLGMATAFASGYAAVYFLRRIVQRGKFGGFCYYCWGAGLVILILSLVA